MRFNKLNRGFNEFISDKDFCRIINGGWLLFCTPLFDANCF